MKLYIISFTEKGDILNDLISSRFLNYQVYSYPKRNKRESLSIWTETAFNEGDAIIFIGAVGIAVRAISPYVKNKAEDPAVVVCDELGKYVIPILSGHIGGANALSMKIAQEIGAMPVITTATDINNVWAVDNWAVKKGFKILNIENIKYISAALLKGKKVGIVSDIFVDKKELPTNVVMNETDTECGIVLSPYVKNIYKHTLNLIPKSICIGVGSRKDSDENSLINLLNDVLSENNIDIYSIKEIATIDIKAKEKSIQKLCEYVGVNLKCFSATELNKVVGDFTKSDFVKKITGTDNVCEKSAVLLSNGRIVVSKTIGNGVTLALAINQ